MLTNTVILETEWGLRTRFKYSREQILSLFRGLSRLDNVEFEHAGSIAAATEAFAEGMDFADALHVCSAIGVGTFITFDRDLVRLAGKHIDHVSVELAS